MTSSIDRPLPGGPLAIDLLNTEWLTSTGPVDWFDDAACVQRFAAEYGSAVTTTELAAIKAALVEVRALVRRLFTRSSDDDGLIDEVNATLAQATAVLVTTDDRAALKVTGDRPGNELAIEALVNAIELIADRPDRVRSCEHEACVLWFHDTSKAGRRRWCSMETCGNRAKARRHYQRSANPAAG